MLIDIRHVTRYSYGHPVDHALQRLRLTPGSSPAQDVLSWSIDMPGIETAISYLDFVGNPTHLVICPEPVESIEVIASGSVETRETHGVIGFDTSSTPPWVFLRETPLTAANPALRRFAETIPEGALLERLHAILEAIHEKVAYETDATHAGTTAQEAFKLGSGVCQDHTHIFICVARELGIPARYVTGYLRLDEEAAEMAHHAWAEAFVPDIGWVGFDAANGISSGERYIRLAGGFDAVSTSPVTGARQGGGDEVLDVTVEVRQAEEQESQ
ncbi:MAG: transglutaminase family protein [Gammaproteobacteria bacterium]|nr:transglutaminase family protein [Gammaproteobacteria bacterium]